jgi:hypothetical protein
VLGPALIAALVASLVGAWGISSRVAGVLNAGSVLFLVAIGLFAWATREAGLRDCSVTLLYRAALLVLAVSATIGVRLAR